MSLALAPAQPLDHAATGRYCCQRILATGANGIRLKRLGICEGRIIELIGRGDPMVLRIGDSRIGLSKRLAQAVEVVPADEADASITAA